MENPLAVANYFIEKSFQTGNELTPMKLVKLVYIAHGWHLALTGRPLIDEAVQAWKYGPVINSLYHTFKAYGNDQILRMESEFKDLHRMTPKVNESIKPFLDRIWEVYRRLNGVQLSSLTHQPNTPWYIVWHNRGGKENKAVIIPNDLIQFHYKEKANAGTAVNSTES
jgi:uncharacterized phage-associated protein